MNLQIVVDPLTGPEIAALLREHLDDMYRLSPPESVHALDLSKLRQADVTFWSAWSGDELLGCAALRELDGWHGEIKSMRTALVHRGRGVGGALMRRILEEAEQRGYRRLSLETGPQPEFAPARALYRRYGFDVCGPFDRYVEDPFSTFMTRTLAGAHNRNER
ncbi:GNAT family N-acetyltransferase [Pseudoxanthomonas jiangsuensis]|uniref:GNAT family N-acetyltransferase n=1 Tax=Pseudoxanthomonas jiangsuensis TaxID=619688 RepID=UPI001391C541|nr:GNAT family N-acetyltransferase [Pseudoxanthomonas jiangsuensis]KAF1694868.1 GNAT family N-acetyltransferase [Pseudoxanthomonas jiangsuensis]